MDEKAEFAARLRDAMVAAGYERTATFLRQAAADSQKGDDVADVLQDFSADAGALAVAYRAVAAMAALNEREAKEDR